MGNLYYKGNGVPKNNKTAMRWWKYAAQQGNADSQNNLGYMIGNGWVWEPLVLTDPTY